MQKPDKLLLHLYYIMFAIFVYLLIIFTLIALILLIISYYSFSVILSIKGNPFYLPIGQKKINKILSSVKIKESQKFVEIGSGDGRFVRAVSTKYNCNCMGVEINPLLSNYSKILNKIFSAKKISILNKNIFDVDISDADLIYFFLLPDFILKLENKIKSEIRKNTIIISHGFTIPYLNKKLFKKISDKPFSTYYYKM